MIKFIVLSLFPNLFEEFRNTSIIKNATMSQKVSIELVDIRDFSTDKHNRVDFPPFGGGAGMVISAEPLSRAIEFAFEKLSEDNKNIEVIYLSPRGSVLNYDKSLEFANSNSNYILICGHYEGIDERIIEEYDVKEISIGDYVLTGGELPAMVLMDSIIRLIPGVISKDSLLEESHTNFLLEYPQYTKPLYFKSKKVPDVLTTGHHKNINDYRETEAIKITLKNRPDLIQDALDSKKLSKELLKKIIDIKGGENNGHN